MRFRFILCVLLFHGITAVFPQSIGIVGERDSSAIATVFRVAGFTTAVLGMKDVQKGDALAQKIIALYTSNKSAFSFQKPHTDKLVNYLREGGKVFIPSLTGNDVFLTRIGISKKSTKKNSSGDDKGGTFTSRRVEEMSGLLDSVAYQLDAAAGWKEYHFEKTGLGTLLKRSLDEGEVLIWCNPNLTSLKRFRSFFLLDKVSRKEISVFTALMKSFFY